MREGKTGLRDQRERERGSKHKNGNKRERERQERKRSVLLLHDCLGEVLGEAGVAEYFHLQSGEATVLLPTHLVPGRETGKRQSEAEDRERGRMDGDAR